MVKNAFGGNKAKGHARKSFAKPTSFAMRTAQDDCEMYAMVDVMLGNGMCHVICSHDGVKRLCHIRGKFRGKGKSSNIVKKGSWLLVGTREWETASDKKMQGCDLLEVYTDVETDKLKTLINWSAFDTSETKNDSAINFTDDKTAEYMDLLGSVGSTSVETKADEDEINVDDI